MKDITLLKKEEPSKDIIEEDKIYYIIKKEYATLEFIQDALCFGAEFICSNGNIYTNL